MNTRPLRVSDNFVRDLKTIGIERISKGVADPFKRNDNSLRKITDEITKTKAWQEVLKELRIK